MDEACLPRRPTLSRACRLAQGTTSGLHPSPRGPFRVFVLGGALEEGVVIGLGGGGGQRQVMRGAQRTTDTPRERRPPGGFLTWHSPAVLPVPCAAAAKSLRRRLVARDRAKASCAAGDQLVPPRGGSSMLCLKTSVSTEAMEAEYQRRT